VALVAAVVVALYSAVAGRVAAVVVALYSAPGMLATAPITPISVPGRE
jgi:hypothetical protein